jgi:hypothetical protein
MKKNQFEFKNLVVPLIGTGIIVCALFILITKGQKSRNRDLLIINQNFKFSKGIITKMFFYKSQRIRIKYKINGVVYEYQGAWDDNPRSLREGDSISFRYSVGHPNLIINELEKDY